MAADAFNASGICQTMEMILPIKDGAGHDFGISGSENGFLQ